MPFYPAFLILLGSYVPLPAADLATFVVLAAGEFAGTLMMTAAYRVAAPVIVAPTQYSQVAWAALVGPVFFCRADDP